jgi:hypothetical protein
MHKTGLVTVSPSTAALPATVPVNATPDGLLVDYESSFFQDQFHSKSKTLE